MVCGFIVWIGNRSLQDQYRFPRCSEGHCEDIITYMKKPMLIVGLLIVFGVTWYFMKKNESPVVINGSVGSLKDVETNKGFIRSIDNVNGKYYAKIDPTEKESCANSEGGDCEENTKNTDFAVFSFPVSGDVQVDGITCYGVEGKKFPINTMQILQNEINNFPDSECGTYATQADWDNLLYLFTFNTAGQITAIKSDPVYNQ
jgi:hypothetical protein